MVAAAIRADEAGISVAGENSPRGSAVMRRLRLCSALVTLAALVPGIAAAQSAWTGASDNDFSNGANWSTAPTAPGVGDDATIASGAPTVGSNAAVQTLGVSGGVLHVDADLGVSGGTTLSDPGRIDISTTGRLSSDVTMSGGSLGNSGTLDGDLTASGGTVVNDGLITGETLVNGAALTNNGSLRDLIIATGSAVTNNGSGSVSGATTITDGTLSNNGNLGSVDVGTSGLFTNNSTGRAGAVINAGTTSNAGTISSLTNTAGSFSNNSGGKITGNTVISGGTVTNNFVVTDVDVAAAANFVNNSGATAGNVTNAGTTSNAGTIASLTNTGGTFSNNSGGTITGRTEISGGTVTNNFVVTDVDVAAAAEFINNSDATAGNVTNAGTASNAGTIASLTNTGGTFSNTGTISGYTRVSDGKVINNFVVTDVDVAATAEFVNNSGATAGDITNAGTSSNAGTVASLTNTGGTFANDGTITGSTAIAGGTVTNNFVVTDVDVAAAASFVNNSDATAGNVTNAGISSNAGTIASLTNTGGTFTNNSGGTITGKTTVTGGTVTNNFVVTDVDVAAAASFVNNATGVAGNVTNAGTSSNDGVIASLTNTGGTFANTGTITGAATVTGGTLVNDGAVSGAIDIGKDGTLSGSGAVGGLTVASGGTLSPGPGIATTTVNGDVTFEKGSRFEVETNASGKSDRLAATGSVTIEGGTVQVLAGSGSYSLASQYTILTADSVTGTFDDVTTDLAFLTPTLSYATDAVTLGLYRNDVAFADVATTANGRATANAVESLGAKKTVYLGVLPLDAADARYAFSQLGGEIHASLKTALLSDSRFIRDAILDRVNGEIPVRPTEDGAAGVWMTGIAAKSRIGSDGNAAGIDTSAAGLLAGIDGELSDHWRLGGVFGYDHGSTGRDADWDSYQAAIYAAGEWGGFSLVGGAAYSKNEISTRRHIAFGTFTDDLEADYDSATRQVFADFSWHTRLGPVSVQPFVNLAYINLDTDGFREKGGAAALSGSSGNDDITLATLGMRWSADLLADDTPITLAGMLGWRRAIGDLTPSTRLSFSSGSPFVLEGVATPRDALVVEASVTAQVTKTTRLKLGYSGEFAHSLTTHAARASLIVDF
jgi:outer membrane autotransporter protein